MSDRKIIALLVIFQFVLCLVTVHYFPISLDEPFSIYHAQYPLNEMISEISQGNNSPLHFVLLHYWMKIGGIGLFSVRLLSILTSLVTIIFLFKLSRKFLKPMFSVLVVGLFIFSRLNHYVAMEARMYGLFTLFFVLLLFDFYRLLFENKKVVFQLALWNALLMYTHYLGGVVILLECVIFLCFYKHWSKGKWKQVISAAILGGILFIPGIKIFLNRATDFQNKGTWVPDATLSDLWTNFVKLMNNQFTVIFTLVTLIGLFVFIKRKQEIKQRHILKFFVLWFVVGYILMFVLSVTIQPIFFIKYLQYLTIPLFFTLVLLLQQFDWEGKKKYLPLLLLLPFLFSFKPVPDVNRETDVLVAYVKSNQIEGTNIYYCPPFYDLNLAYHYDRAIFADYENTSTRLEEQGLWPIYSGLDLINQKSGKRIIYIDFESKFLYPDNNILETLDNDYHFVESKSFKGGFNVYIYNTL